MRLRVHVCCGTVPLDCSHCDFVCNTLKGDLNHVCKNVNDTPKEHEFYYLLTHWQCVGVFVCHARHSIIAAIVAGNKPSYLGSITAYSSGLGEDSQCPIELKVTCKA